MSILICVHCLLFTNRSLRLFMLSSFSLPLPPLVKTVAPPRPLVYFPIVLGH